MNQQQLTGMADKLRTVFDQSDLNESGRKTEFSSRERIITPLRLALSLILSFAAEQVETLADLCRNFNALFTTTITYEAFYNQSAKEEFPRFAVSLVSRILSEMTFKILRFGKGRPFSEFEEIIIRDGSSFGVGDRLRQILPGRFGQTSPAAVELRTTMDLLRDSPVRIVLTPDTGGGTGLSSCPGRSEKLSVARRSGLSGSGIHAPGAPERRKIHHSGQERPQSPAARCLSGRRKSSPPISQQATERSSEPASEEKGDGSRSRTGHQCLGRGLPYDRSEESRRQRVPLPDYRS